MVSSFITTPQMRDYVVQCVLDETRTRNADKIKGLIFKYWSDCEKKMGEFVNLSLDDYDYIINTVFTLLPKMTNVVEKKIDNPYSWRDEVMPY